MARFALALERHPRIVERLFTEGERRDAHDRPERLAARFAAKEAVHEDASASASARRPGARSRSPSERRARRAWCCTRDAATLAGSARRRRAARLADPHRRPAAAFVVGRRRATSPVPAEGVHRPAWAEISRVGHRPQRRALQAVVGETPLCAVVKANGYGHGAPLVATGGARGRGRLARGRHRRRGHRAAPRGIDGADPAARRDPARRSSTPRWPTTSRSTVGSLAAPRRGRARPQRSGGRHRVHVKVDTGMHRMGVAPEDVDEVVDVLLASPGDRPRGALHPLQRGRRRERRGPRLHAGPDRLASTRSSPSSAIAGSAPRVIHLANSAGRARLPRARVARWCASGSRSTATCPTPGSARRSSDAGAHLEPALTLRAQVVAARRVEAGERPSYGRRRALDAWTRPS